MGERAPLSVTFYLGEADAALFRSLWPAVKGCRFDEHAHQKLIDQGLLEVEEFNPGPNGECNDDVRLTKKGESEIVRLKQLADEGFKNKRASTTRARSVPDSPAVERSSRGPVPARGGFPSGHASSPEPQANAYRAEAGPAQEEPTP
jgi:hypothetical protein